jgi:hypothetical protein
VLVFLLKQKLKSTIIIISRAAALHDQDQMSAKWAKLGPTMGKQWSQNGSKMVKTSLKWLKQLKMCPK